MAQAVYRQEGKAINYTPGADVDAGQVTVLGNGLLGIAKRDIASGEQGALHVEDVYRVAKATGAVSLWDRLYWDADGDPVDGDAGTGALTTTASGNTFAGWAVAAAESGDETVDVLFVGANPQSDASREEIALIPVEDLGAGVDIATRPVFVHPRSVTLISATILTQGAPAGIDAGNTMVVALTDDAANSIVSKTYNNTTVLPSSDAEDLGTLSATHKVLAALEHVLLSVTNGATANPPAFVIALRYTVNG